MNALSVFACVALGVPLLTTASGIVTRLLNRPRPEHPCNKDFDVDELRDYTIMLPDMFNMLSGQDDSVSFSEEEIYNALHYVSLYINGRFDCSDFRVVLLFKMYKECKCVMSSRCSELIKKTLLDFKYFMDEPGKDSMCYWSENHQILFAVNEYLAGQEWPEEIFSNAQMSGKEHMIKAKERIEAWMEQRFKYGFSEYLSNCYITEDLAPMANYIAFCEDKISVERMKAIMDILLFDIALNSTANRFVATSTRMYANNKASNYTGNSIQAAMNVLWGKEALQKLSDDNSLDENEKNLAREAFLKKPNHILICFTDIVKKGIYVLPPAIKDAALSDKNFTVKMNCGLSPSDMENDGLIGMKPNQIMAQLGAEAFTNPQVVNNTRRIMKDYHLGSNSFVSYFKYLEIFPLRFIDWQKFSKNHELMTNGIALSRGNIYSYRTPYYVLSTSVAKCVDDCGTQDHTWSANISETVSLFTTHPAGNGKNRYGSSPGYWIGNGRRPMSVQNKNVNITIYKLPEKRRFPETVVFDMTHAFMPKNSYDEFYHNKNVVIARKNGVFVALISNGDLEYKQYDTDVLMPIYKTHTFNEGSPYTITGEFDLCRYGGKYHMYITELSDYRTESFEDFKERILHNFIDFSQDGKAIYSSICGKMEVSYDGKYVLNGKEEQPDYDRYDCDFCHAEKKPSVIEIKSSNHSLKLDYYNNTLSDIRISH